MFNRQKDPRTAEELMCAEYQRLVEKLENLSASYENVVEQLHNRESQIKDMEVAFNETNRKRDAKMEEFLQQNTGIVDLHRSMTLVKCDIWSDYNLRSWARDNTDTNAEAIAKLNSLLAMTNEDLLKEAQTTRHSYYGRAIVIDERKARYTLSLPYSDKRVISVFEPSIYNDRLIDPVDDPKEDLDEKWTSLSREEVEEYATKKLRFRIQSAIARLKEDSDD